MWKFVLFVQSTVSFKRRCLNTAWIIPTSKFVLFVQNTYIHTYIHTYQKIAHVVVSKRADRKSFLLGCLSVPLHESVSLRVWSVAPVPPLRSHISRRRSSLLLSGWGEVHEKIMDLGSTILLKRPKSVPGEISEHRIVEGMPKHHTKVTFIVILNVNPVMRWCMHVGL